MARIAALMTFLILQLSLALATATLRPVTTLRFGLRVILTRTLTPRASVLLSGLLGFALV